MITTQPLVFVPPVIACRGASARTPENTLAAFHAAQEDGATWIKTEIKLTADGIPVLLHDDALERTTNGQGAVADMTWVDMQKLDAGSWFAASFHDTRVTALAELLAFAYTTGMRLNLELRPCPGRTRATAMVALIEAAKLWPETSAAPLISSFDIEALTIASQLHPGWPRGLLMDVWRDDWQDMVAATQATTLHINAELLTPDRLDILRGTKTPILAYTINDPQQAKQLLASGVSAVFSNDPAKIIRGL